MNALQYIFIPDYKATVSFIQSTLEEREREETFRLKLLKNRAGKKNKLSAEPELLPNEFDQPYRDIMGQKGGYEPEL